MKRLAWVIGIAAVATLSVFVAIYLFELATGTKYSTEQWSAAGGWVGGIGAVVAVGIAVYQSWQSNKHLREELDAARRSEQISSVIGVWPSIAELRDEFDIFRAAVNAVSGGTDSGTVRAEIQRVTKDHAPNYRRAVKRADLAFELPLLQVTEPKTRDFITAMYQDFLALWEHSSNLIRSAELGNSPPFADHEGLIRKVESQKGPYTNVIRVNLTRAQPLQDVANASEDE